MADVIVQKLNEVHLTIKCEPHIDYELRDYFTFEVPNAKFMPQYRGRNWNGEIHLYDLRSKRLYVGLLDKLISFCDRREYTYEFVDNKYYGLPFEINEMISEEGLKDYYASITKFKPRDYQIRGVCDSLKHNRRLLISPTASGKSLMIYGVVRYYVSTKQKILLVVPTTSLVEQLYKDFEDYGWDAESYCHRIYSGREKTNEFPVTITTWQSVFRLDRSFFTDFDVIIGDEAHLFKSKSLTGIMTKLHNAKYRFGFTGTLDGSKTHKWVLEGLFGSCDRVTKTDDLIKSGYLSKFRIKILLCQHAPEHFETYHDEIDYLCEHRGRNNLIKNLVKDLDGNTLVLFNYIEKHGEPLFEIINNSIEKDRKTFFVHGGTEVEDREEVRQITEEENNAIIVASYGTFSTGINIKRLHNIVFASPSKSRIRNLQSIGRVLRRGEGKDIATLYDVADDIGGQNYTLKHLNERVNIYNDENFKYEVIKINLRAN